MKKWIALFATLSLAACQTTQNEENDIDLIGAWVGTDFHFDEQSEGDHADMIRGGMELHFGSNLSLNADSSFQVSDANGQTNGEGKWYVEGNQLMVVAFMDTTDYIIHALDDSSLVTRHHVLMSLPHDTIEGDILLTYKRLEYVRH